jgi:hypothetical protein
MAVAGLLLGLRSRLPGLSLRARRASKVSMKLQEPSGRPLGSAALGHELILTGTFGQKSPPVKGQLQPRHRLDQIVKKLVLCPRIKGVRKGGPDSRSEKDGRV